MINYKFQQDIDRSVDLPNILEFTASVCCPYAAAAAASLDQEHSACVVTTMPPAQNGNSPHLRGSAALHHKALPCGYCSQPFPPQRF